MLAMAGGFAMAAISFTTTGTINEGSVAVTIGSVAGLTWKSGSLLMTSPVATAACATVGTGCDMDPTVSSVPTPTSVVVCASNSCTASDYYQSIVLTNDATICATASHIATITVSVTATPTSAVTTGYLFDTNTISSGGTQTATFEVDLGATPVTGISAINVVASC